MPYKCVKIKLPETLDRRVKLTSSDKDVIKQLYKSGGTSLNKLAQQYGVSKKTILLIVNPESKLKNDLYIKNNGSRFKQDTDTRNYFTREHRRYKHGLYVKGLISDDK